jgi:ABC-2 type transport system ATP-binding protein
MIKAETLTKRYGDLTAVDGVSFEIQSGETFGFLGPNGAGKSTTINMLAGVLKPDAGRVVVDGAGDPSHASVRARLGIAPQALAIYEELTGEENLSFFGKLYNLPSRTRRERVAWALDFVGLSGRSKDRVKTYSGGMQRRLNLACALVHDPELLLLDEPTVGVDPQSRNLIFEKIEQLNEQGRTVLYTTHYMEEAQRLCDRVAIIDQGRILALDTVDNLIARHGGDATVRVTLAKAPQSAGGLPGQLEGNVLTVTSSDPMAVLSQLSALGLPVSDLHIDRADLETVFLNLTGRRLRD